MTPKEAIDYMENEIRCIQRARYCDRDCAKCKLVKEDKPLIEAFGEAIKALEKQIPKKPIITTNNKEVPKTHSYGRLLQYQCPTCGHLLFTRYETDTFCIDGDYNCCSKCGQKFDVKELKRRKSIDEDLELE